MILKKIIFISIAILFVTKLFSQDKITLLNGQEYDGQITDTSFLNISILRDNRKEPFVLERYRIFSINWNGNESVFYRQDLESGNHKTQPEMRLFIIGEQDSKKMYKTPLLIIGGFAAGFFGGFLQPIIADKLGASYYAANNENPHAWMGKLYAIPIVPITYTLFSGSRWIKIDKNKISNKIYLSEDSYLEGYERVARSKKIQRAIWSSLGGLIGGVFLTSLTSK